MNRNFLILIIGVLIAIILGFAYYTYLQEKKSSSIELKIGQINYLLTSIS
ncbi:hypothetical protein [Bartonella senegalensis]|nr:hypothetical protein [Bartonella senegalensis]